MIEKQLPARSARAGFSETCTRESLSSGALGLMSRQKLNSFCTTREAVKCIANLVPDKQPDAVAIRVPSTYGNRTLAILTSLL